MTDTPAFQLVQYIVTHELQVGAKLPSVRELSDILECNKNQVKSGLSTLEALGVIDIHPRAGAFVKRVSPGDLDTIFLLFYRFGMPGERTDITNIYSIKTLLDREIFTYAARHRTESDLYKLEQNLHRQSGCLGDISAFIQADEDFHRCLSAVCRNPLLDFFQEAVVVMIRPYRMAHLTPTVNEESYRGHCALFAAVKARDVEGAEQLAAQLTMPRLRRLKEETAEPVGVGA